VLGLKEDMRVVLLALSILLTSCAGGTILGAEAVRTQDASHISAAAGAVIRIMPLKSDESFEVEASQDFDLCLSAGWYTVDFNCSTLWKDGKWTAFSQTEYTTDRTIHIASKHNYRLDCSKKTLDVMNIQDMGSTSQ
jgi:hypothetical protein